MSLVSTSRSDYLEAVLPSCPSPTKLRQLPFILTFVAGGCLPRQDDVAPSKTEQTASSANERKELTTAPRQERPTELSVSDPMLSAPFVDDFERTILGKDWRVTSNAWRIDQGRLCAAGARNHPAWLKRRLPTNAIIEFDATSLSPEGDIKAEYWGDGRSRASGVSYDDATSYLTIFGGWKNRYHVLARLDEHAKDRQQLLVDPTSGELRNQPVKPERTYRFRVERRDGKAVSWHVDGEKILVYSDPRPLKGKGHEHFGYNNWEARVCFDNLQVTPLGS